MTEEMAVGGRTKEVMRFVGAQGFLISHAHGHVKAPAIRSQSSSRVPSLLTTSVGNSKNGNGRVGTKLSIQLLILAQMLGEL